MFKSKFRRIFLTLLVISILVFGWSYIKLKSIKDKIFIQSHISEVGAQSANQTLGDHFNSKTRFNILLLGYGGGIHDGAYLTDSMMVVNTDPGNKKINLISIPRDIWIKIPTNGTDGSHWKINAAYELGLDDNDYPKKLDQFKGEAGGGNMAKYVVEQVSGLHIDKFVALDFDGFRKTIDSLNGVDVNVETTFDDYEYPIDGKENDLCGHQPSELPNLEKTSTTSPTQAFPCRYFHLHFDSGTTHMDGEKALEYVRSRHSLQDGTDFGRSKRQRNLLLAVKQKVFSIGFITKILPFANSLQDDLKTDLSLEEAQQLVTQANNLKTYAVSNLALTDQNVLTHSITDDGQAILISQDGQDKWDSIHFFISSGVAPSNFNASPTIKVENGTAISGLATLATNRLQDKDFNLLPPTNSEKTDLENTTISILDDKIDPKVLSELKTEFNVKDLKKETKTDQDYDILITLGQDYNSTQGKKLIN